MTTPHSNPSFHPRSDSPQIDIPPRQNLTVDHQNLTLYVDFPPLLQDILQDLHSAQHRIWIEMYIFASDSAGQAIAQILRQKAQAGLDVRLLYDAVGCQLTPSSFFSQLSHAGVKVHCFHGLTEALSRFRLFSIMNFRNHRKLIVIDDHLAYFGGMNIIDTSQTPYPPTQRNKSGFPTLDGWRDLHLRLHGTQQSELAESFERSWLRALRQKVARRPRAYRRARILKPQPDSPPTPPNQEAIHFFDSGPGLKYSRAARIITRMLRRSETSLLIAMAYFVPVGRVLRSLLAARKRGVRVRVIVPGQSDVPLVQHATTYLYRMLLKRGFRLYERQTRMLHSKLIVIDNTWTILGSCNLDPRSLWINLELLAVIRSPQLAQIMTRIYQSELQQSIRVRPHHLHLPWHQRLLNTLAWSLRWWL